MWCCPPFQGVYDNATERGFSIALADEPRVGFVLRHRAVAADDVSKLVTPIVVSVVSETGVDYCPWCGQHLTKFYKPLVLEQIRRRRT
jgi:hypothetical protein